VIELWLVDSVVVASAMYVGVAMTSLSRRRLRF
jgi:hypothetical protein